MGVGQSVNASINVDKSPNIIKRLFNKYNDLEEQRYSERCQIALKIMQIIYETQQCTKEELDSVKKIIQFPERLNYSIYKLDMMVDPNDRLPYDKSKWHFVVFSVLDESYTEVNKKDEKKSLGDIQEILMFSMHKIDKIMITVLLRNDLIDYWES